MPYFYEREKICTNVANKIVRRKVVEQTLKDMNEWVDELHTDINDTKMAVKAL